MPALSRKIKKNTAPYPKLTTTSDSADPKSTKCISKPHARNVLRFRCELSTGGETPANFPTKGPRQAGKVIASYTTVLGRLVAMLMVTWLGCQASETDL